MRIQLPTETWMEVLGWLRRDELAQLLEQLPADRLFTKMAQSLLHDIHKNVRLGHLHIDAADPTLAPWKAMLVRHEGGGGQNHWPPLAVAQMPDNIVTFRSLQIDYLDTTVLNFVRLMGRLFTNVHLRVNIYERLEIPGAIMALRHLLPLVSSLESVAIDDRQLLDFLMDRHRPALLGAKMLSFSTATRKHIEYPAQVLINWLFSRREDGQPRVLLLALWDGGADKVMAKICQRFRAATSAATSFVRIHSVGDSGDLGDQPALHNFGTGEQLLVRKEDTELLVSRCSLEVHAEWLAKKESEVLQMDSWSVGERKLRLDGPKIGPLPRPTG